MQKELDKILTETKGTFGIAIKHLERDEETIINGDKFFQLASVVKVQILTTLMHEVGKGNLDLLERVTIKNTDKVPGSGVLKEMDEGMTVTIKDLATLMIIISDNMATDKLLKIVGLENVNRYMKELGLEQLSIDYSIWKLLALSAGLEAEPQTLEKYAEITLRLNDRANWEIKSHNPIFQENSANNTATVIEFNRLLEKIQLSDGIPESESTQILDILSRQQVRQRLPRLLPEGTKVAHKTGTIGKTANDAGIIYLPDNKGTLIITIFSEGNESLDEGAAIISKISLAAFEYYLEK